MTLDEIENLCRAIDDFDPDESKRICRENDERPCCLVCNGEYTVDIGCEHAALCYGCADSALTDLARAVLAMVPLAREADLWQRQIIGERTSYDLRLEAAIDALRHSIHNGQAGET